MMIKSLIDSLLILEYKNASIRELYGDFVWIGDKNNDLSRPYDD